MLEVAGQRNSDQRIEYRHAAIEDLDFEEGAFDIVLSSLAFHYVRDLELW